MLGKALLNLDQVAAKLDPQFDPNAAIRDHVGEVMRAKMLQSARPANIAAFILSRSVFSRHRVDTYRRHRSI